MILVHVIRSWPDVLAGEMSADEATLGEWAQLSDKNLRDHGDVVVGIYNNKIVSAYEVHGHYRDRETGRVTFAGRTTPDVEEYIGAPNPGRQWGDQGYARSVQCLPTSVLTDPLIEQPAEGLKVPRSRRREPTAKRKGAWVTEYPNGVSMTLWDDGDVKVGMWDHRLVLIDPKPRNYKPGKSRGAGLIRMRFEPLEPEDADQPAK